MFWTVLSVGVAGFCLLMGLSGAFAAPRIVAARHERQPGPNLPVTDDVLTRLVRWSGVLMLGVGVLLLLRAF